MVLLGEDAEVLDRLLMAPPLTRPSGPRDDAAIAPAPPAPGSAPSDAEELGLAAVAERARQGAERQAIERALIIARWRRTDVARVLKISYRTLLRKMREYGLGQ